ncbi:MAG: polysaccharide biosynthesis/export family protein [Pirellulales bacterium]|nr:polysaccharide biosynthesis/export family protein [Pirellulales bacterium]
MSHEYMHCRAKTRRTGWNGLPLVLLCLATGCGVLFIATSPCSAQCVRSGVPYRNWVTDARHCGAGCELGWRASPKVNWHSYAHGDYVGHARIPHVPEYRIRVDDQLAFVFRLTREESSKPYELQVGDRIRVESLTGDSGSDSGDTLEDDNLGRELIIQPDGTISLPLLGQVRAAQMTVDNLRQQLEQRYKKYYKVPAITITPLEVNTRLQDLLASVDARQGVGGLQLQVTVTPAGRIYIPGLGAICAQGLTLEELKYEIDARYAVVIPGVAVTPVLVQRAARFVYVLGEVAQPGQFELTGPTTLMGALAQAGSWNPGANLRQVVIFRRDPQWRLVATMLDIRGALYGGRPTPADEIWINDTDVIVVTKKPIQTINELIDQFFTQGLYGLFPQYANGQFNFRNFSSLSN